MRVNVLGPIRHMISVYLKMITPYHAFDPLAVMMEEIFSTDIPNYINEV